MLKKAIQSLTFNYIVLHLFCDWAIRDAHFLIRDALKSVCHVGEGFGSSNR